MSAASRCMRSTGITRSCGQSALRSSPAGAASVSTPISAAAHAPAPTPPAVIRSVQIRPACISLATEGALMSGEQRSDDGHQAAGTVADGAVPGQPRGGHLPGLIQGGMGVGVSGWQLARAVAAAGQLGVVSGVALDAVLARRLQCGDPGGDVRRALADLPLAGVAERIIGRYYVPGGIKGGQPFRPVPRLGLRPNMAGTELAVAGNFAEVHLAKEGHGGLVGINYLEKVQLATPAALYGAMLAGVDYVLMGAGIPVEIPALLNSLAAAEPAELTVAVAGAPAGIRHVIRLDPGALFDGAPAMQARPQFLAIVSSAVLTAYLTRTPASAPDGFVLEGPAAGGNSAPPRGRLRLDAGNEPVYGPRDEIDLTKGAALGLPFWLAGGQARAGRLATARTLGAAGIQVGTAFALCRESGIDPGLRSRLIEQAMAGTLAVRNDPYTSPGRVSLQGGAAVRRRVRLHVDGPLPPRAGRVPAVPSADLTACSCRRAPSTRTISRCWPDQGSDRRRGRGQGRRRGRVPGEGPRRRGAAGRRRQHESAAKACTCAADQGQASCIHSPSARRRTSWPAVMTAPHTSQTLPGA